MKLFVAMSGGVDSAVAALLLHREGHEVVGIHLRTGVQAPASSPGARPRCCGTDEAEDARRVCGLLGIPYYVRNAAREFETIIDRFVKDYAQGETPNPCLACNAQVKFGTLLERARALGADAVATGHYARRVRHGNRWAVARAHDRSKDQSYVLYALGPDELEHARFPLGDRSKEEVRALAREAGLPVADKPESQEICFVPGDDYRDLVRTRMPGALAQRGEIVDLQGRVLGAHSGIAGFTVGQRKGLGVAGAEPYYVTALDPARQRVTVGPRSSLGVESAGVREVRWTAIPPPAAAVPVSAVLRYRAPPVPATVTPVGGDRARIEFLRPAWPVTPGQAAVFYDGEVVLGGGRLN